MTLYGYKIENGTALIVEEQAENLRKFFENYMSGMALAASAEKAGFKISHSMAKKKSAVNIIWAIIFILQSLMKKLFSSPMRS